MAKPTKPTKTKIQAFLKAHGHPLARVNALALNSDEQKRLDLCAIHGISRAEYARAGV